MRRPSFPESEIARESTKIFFRAIATETFFVAFSTLGAIATGFVAWRFGAATPARTIVWCGLVGLSEFALTAIDQRFSRAPPPVSRYGLWTSTKSALTTLHGFAWGLGPILLHQAGGTLSTLAPAWAIILFTAGVLYSCASIPKCVVATIFAALAPGSIWLVLFGSAFERSVAICMAVSLPFTAIIGLFAARQMRALIVSRLEITALLDDAQKAQRERARFYSSASHDLRQPVHALGFYTSMLQRVTDAEKKREIERHIDDCAKSLDRQFSAIVGMAEVDRAVERASPRIIAVQAVLDAVAANVRPEAYAKNIDIRVVRTRHFIYADADLLERVIQNLTSNAVRYTRHGRVLIGARPSGAHVRICVIDSGVGIPDEEKHLIFEDFYQAGARTREHEKGFGLGLAIVRRLCLAMEWDLEMLSVVNRGSQFTVSVAAADPPDALKHDMSLSGPGRLSENLVVLVVACDPSVRETTSRQLAKWGVRTTICATADEAIAALGARQPSEQWHALLDARFASTDDGLSLVRRLRLLGGPSFRVTLMSAPHDALDARNRELGTSVLQLPMKAIRLRAVLSAPLD